MRQKNNDFDIFSDLKIDTQSKHARKAYRARPTNLWVHLENDDKPFPVENISITGLSFSIENDKYHKEMQKGQDIVLHLYSDTKSNLLTLYAQVVRIIENTCSCFFPELKGNDARILDKLILEMQKIEIVLSKLEERKELELEKEKVKELRNTQLTKKFHNEPEAANPPHTKQEEKTEDTASNQGIKTSSQAPSDDSTPHANPLAHENQQNSNDFKLFDDLNIVTGGFNRREYRASPTNLSICMQGETQHRNVYDISTSSIRFSYKEDTPSIQQGEHITIDIFVNKTRKVLTITSQIVRINNDSCSCIFPLLINYDMKLLDKLVLEMQKTEISLRNQHDTSLVDLENEKQAIRERKIQREEAENTLDQEYLEKARLKIQEKEVNQESKKN